MSALTQPVEAALLTGRDDTHLQEVEPGQRLLPEVAAAYGQLREAAARAGFELAIASAHRDYQRQLAIFNRKVVGARPVHDDDGRVLDVAKLTVDEVLRAVLRFSALPGASRHHWGTDLDVFDAAALRVGEQVELVPREVAPGGPFDPFHLWLDQRMASGESFGFFRPYTGSYCAVAPERWHLSYAPLALAFSNKLTLPMVVDCWDKAGSPAQRDRLEAQLPELFEHYVRVAPGWCPSS